MEKEGDESNFSLVDVSLYNQQGDLSQIDPERFFFFDFFLIFFHFIILLILFKLLYFHRGTIKLFADPFKDPIRTLKGKKKACFYFNVILRTPTKYLFHFSSFSFLFPLSHLPLSKAFDLLLSWTIKPSSRFHIYLREVKNPR